MTRTVKKRSPVKHVVQKRKKPLFSVSPPNYQNAPVTEHLRGKGAELPVTCKEMGSTWAVLSAHSEVSEVTYIHEKNPKAQCHAHGKDCRYVFALFDQVFPSTSFIPC